MKTYRRTALTALLLALPIVLLLPSESFAQRGRSFPRPTFQTMSPLMQRAFSRVPGTPAPGASPAVGPNFRMPSTPPATSRSISAGTPFLSHSYPFAQRNPSGTNNLSLPTYLSGGVTRGLPFATAFNPGAAPQSLSRTPPATALPTPRTIFAPMSTAQLFGGGRAAVGALLTRAYQAAPFTNTATAAAGVVQARLAQRLTTAATTLPNLNAATNGLGAINGTLASRQVQNQYFQVARSVYSQDRALMKDVLGYNPYSALYRGYNSSLYSAASPYAATTRSNSGGGNSGIGAYAPSSSATDVITVPTPAANPAPQNGAAREVDAPVIPGARISVDIRVPVRNAEVWFEGTQSMKEGLARSFTAPALGPKPVHTYRVRAKWLENGRTVDETMDVPIKAGETVSVEFTAPRREAGQ